MGTFLEILGWFVGIYFLLGTAVMLLLVNTSPLGMNPVWQLVLLWPLALLTFLGWV